MALARASFPLPIRYEQPELRFTLRDGARFASYLQSLGVDATKLLLGNPATDTPDSPLLKIASQAQWNDPAWWKTENYDLVIMYGRPIAATPPSTKQERRHSCPCKADLRVRVGLR